VRQLTDVKEMIEWLLAPIMLAMLWLTKIWHGQQKWLTKHETAIALLVNNQDAEANKRTEQRAELIKTMNRTDGKIDTLTSRFNDLLIELAEQRGAKK
jgi:hypothetical protein